MENHQIKYTKLCGSTNALAGGVQRLMITDDHLLIAIKKGTNEEYRRFLLKEICQLTVYRTRWGMFTNIIASLIFAFFLFCSILFYYTKINEISFAFAVLAFFALVFLFINVLYGPTGKVLLTTLNSEDSIVFSHHFHKTLKVLRKIRPMIEIAQGGATREETIARLAGHSGKADNAGNLENRDSNTTVSSHLDNFDTRE